MPRVVDQQVARPGDARLANLAGDDRRVRGGAAAGGDDALRHGHAVEVVRGRLDANEDDLLAAVDPFDGRVGVEHGPSNGRARRGVEPVHDLGGALERGLVECGAQELVDVGRLDPRHCLLLRDEALLDHVDGDPHGRGRGPLGRARLEHVQPAALDRELEVLDVAVVALELLADALEFRVDLRHLGLHLRDLRRRPDAGDDVLALGIGEVLAEELLFAGVRIAGERDAGAGVVAHVPEDHRHDIHGGAEVVRDLLAVAVVHRALAEPRPEDGLDREVELLVRVRREVAAGGLADDRAVLAGDLAQVLGAEVGVLRDPAGGLLRVERVVEFLAGHIHHDAPEHLDEPPVGVPAETLVAGQRDEALQRVLVQAEIEDRVHHPRHRELRAGADAHEERVRCVAEALAGLPFDLLDGLEDVIPEPVGELLAVREEVVARFGRDREAGWDGQPGVGHLGQPGALAAEQVAHRRIALGATSAPGVDVALRGGVGPIGPGCGGRGHWASSSGAAARAPRNSLRCARIVPADRRGPALSPA